MAKLGVCGICGQAVMRALREPWNGTLNGHTFKNGRLVRVRCDQHGGSLFEPSPGVSPHDDCFGGYLPGRRVVRGNE